MALPRGIRRSHDENPKSGYSRYLIKISIPFITSLAEQKKIIAHLDSIYQKIKAVKELQEQTEKELSVLEKSILSKAFTSELI